MESPSADLAEDWIMELLPLVICMLLGELGVFCMMQKSFSAVLSRLFQNSTNPRFRDGAEESMEVPIMH